AGTLPYGHQRRLEIARAMCTHPRLICLDEPAAGLNPRETQELAALIRELRQDYKATVLLIEHDMSLVMGISDHIVVLDQGKVIAAGTPQVVANSPEVIHAYLGVEDKQTDTVVSA
ncbi:MAG: ATP-binding cassette domain-containing protein, partial [Cyanobium sp. ELA712]